MNKFSFSLLHFLAEDNTVLPIVKEFTLKTQLKIKIEAPPLSDSRKIIF